MIFVLTVCRMSVYLMIRKDASKILYLVTVLRHHAKSSNSCSYQNTVRAPLGSERLGFLICTVVQDTVSMLFSKSWETMRLMCQKHLFTAQVAFQNNKHAPVSSVNEFGKG